MSVIVHKAQLRASLPGSINLKPRHICSPVEINKEPVIRISVKSDPLKDLWVNLLARSFRRPQTGILKGCSMVKPMPGRQVAVTPTTQACTANLNQVVRMMQIIMQIN